jgi:hypothetical protein
VTLQQAEEIEMKRFMTVLFAAIMAITLSAPAWAQAAPKKPAAATKQEKKEAKAKAKAEKKAKKADKSKK